MNISLEEVHTKPRHKRRNSVLQEQKGYPQGQSGKRSGKGGREAGGWPTVLHGSLGSVLGQQETGKSFSPDRESWVITFSFRKKHSTHKGRM